MESQGGHCRELREEFRLAKFGLDHGDPSLFVKPQCFKPKFYLIWTTFWAIYYIAMLSLDIHYNIDQGAEYFTYLTNWSYLVQATCVFLDFSVTVYVYCRRKDIRDGQENGMTWYLKWLWVMFNVSNAASIVVTLMYYGLLEAEHSHGSINKHLLNSVYTLLTLILCAKPVQLLHVYHPIIYAILYTVFSIIYHVSGNDPVYSVLDWSNTGSTALFSSGATFIAIPVAHLLTFAIYTMRQFIFYRCKCFKHMNKNEELQKEVTMRDVELQDGGTNKTHSSRTSVDPTKDEYF